MGPVLNWEYIQEYCINCQNVLLFTIHALTKYYEDNVKLNLHNIYSQLSNWEEPLEAIMWRTSKPSSASIQFSIDQKIVDTLRKMDIELQIN